MGEKSNKEGNWSSPPHYAVFKNMWKLNNTHLNIVSAMWLTYCIYIKPWNNNNQVSNISVWNITRQYVWLYKDLLTAVKACKWQDLVPRKAGLSNIAVNEVPVWILHAPPGSGLGKGEGEPCNTVPVEVYSSNELGVKSLHQPHFDRYRLCLGPRQSHGS